MSTEWLAGGTWRPGAYVIPHPDLWSLWSVDPETLRLIAATQALPEPVRAAVERASNETARGLAWWVAQATDLLTDRTPEYVADVVTVSHTEYGGTVPPAALAVWSDYVTAALPRVLDAVGETAVATVQALGAFARGITELGATITAALTRWGILIPAPRYGRKARPKRRRPVHGPPPVCRGWVK